MAAKRSLHLAAAAVEDLAAIRQFVRSAALALAANGDAVPDLVCAVDEAATNVMRHGYLGRPGAIEIQVERIGNDLTARLLDEAPTFDPTVRPSPDLSLPLEGRPPGGLGIPLARASVDRIAHRPRQPRGNELELIKTLDDDQRRAR